jgi:hypothetical protein
MTSYSAAIKGYAKLERTFPSFGSTICAGEDSHD